MTDATEARALIRAAFCDHYRNGRDRSEKCIGEIIEILQGRDSTSDEQVTAILERIIQHYAR